MKNIFNLLTAIFLLVAFNACDEKEMIEYYPENVSTSELTVPGPVTLSMDNENEEISFLWTKADYGINVSVKYALQISTSADFSTFHNLYQNGANTFKVSVKDLNTTLLNKLELDAGVETEIYFRVISSINAKVDDFYSSVKSINLTAYQTDFPPIYMIGAATGGWDPTLAVEVTSSAPNLYNTIAKFTGQEAFRFFGQKDWGPASYNYPYFSLGTISDLFEDAGDGDNNFKFTGETGYYRITVNLKTLTVDMEAVPEPVMYMTGAGIGAWDQPGTGASVKMTFVKENVWEGVATFVPDGAFRFFAQADWGPTNYNYTYFEGGNVSNLLEDAGDGDNNFKFTGTAGDYKVTFNLGELSVVLTEQ